MSKEKWRETKKKYGWSIIGTEMQSKRCIKQQAMCPSLSFAKCSIVSIWRCGGINDQEKMAGIPGATVRALNNLNAVMNLAPPS